MSWRAGSSPATSKAVGGALAVAKQSRTARRTPPQSPESDSRWLLRRDKSAIPPTIRRMKNEDSCVQTTRCNGGWVSRRWDNGSCAGWRQGRMLQCDSPRRLRTLGHQLYRASGRLEQTHFRWERNVQGVGKRERERHHHYRLAEYGNVQHSFRLYGHLNG